MRPRLDGSTTQRLERPTRFEQVGRGLGEINYAMAGWLAGLGVYCSVSTHI